MKLLIDESLQHELARILTKAGHDAPHVTDLDLRGAADDDVLAAAVTPTGSSSPRTPTSAPSSLLALSNAPRPSVILLRRPGHRAPERAQTILTVLELVAEQLVRGSVITVEGSRLRIRELPIRPAS